MQVNAKTSWLEQQRTLDADTLIDYARVAGKQSGHGIAVHSCKKDTL